MKIAKTQYGDIYVDENDIFVGKSLLQHGSFCKNEIDLLSQLIRPGDTVLDIGTNFGYHFLAFSSLVGEAGKVYGFECNTEIWYKFLSYTLKNIKYKNNYCYLSPVFSSNTTLKLPKVCYEGQDRDWGGYSIVGGAALGFSEVQAITIDSLNLESCRLIKADVEGAELEVLKGAEKTIDKHRPILYIECPHDFDLRLEVTHFILNKDYRLYKHTGKFMVDGKDWKCDNFLGVPKEIPYIHLDLEPVSPMLATLGESQLEAGLAEYDKGNIEEATKLIDSAKKFTPKSPKVLLYNALMTLATGDYKSAATDYKARFDVYEIEAGRDRRPWPEIANLDDDDCLSKIEGKTVAIYNLQGLGDYIMMLRYIDSLSYTWKARHVTLVVPKVLYKLFSQRSYVDAQVVLDTEFTPTGVDYKIEINSLLGLLKLTSQQVSHSNPITLISDKWIKKSKTKLIGITYTGSGFNPRQLSRSIPLEIIKKIIGSTSENIKFVSLQYESFGLETLGMSPNKLDTQAIKECQDMMDTLQLMETLDDVVSVDTSIIHLAGAAGIPGLVMLAEPFEWRWGNPKLGKGLTNPWYRGGSIGLARQESPGDWESIIPKVIDWIKLH